MGEDNHHPGDNRKAQPMQPPTTKQLRYLRQLAMQTGQTFTTPRTRPEASAEIQRLKNTPPTGRGERSREINDVRRDLATGAHDATRVDSREITG
ncbi:MAG TPA: hypothetical protein VME01_08190, partial [Solirubrobacteraceae bacterium]|nr:hypothetical protein [Solirubrobacteraceae bacterium]